MPIPVIGAITAGAALGAKAAPQIAKVVKSASKSIPMEATFKDIARQGRNPFELINYIGNKKIPQTSQVVVKAMKDASKNLGSKSGEALKKKIDEYFFQRGLAGKKFPGELGKAKGLIEHYTQKGKEAVYRAALKSQKYKDALKNRAESE